jgi:hypothetical protein
VLQQSLEGFTYSPTHKADNVGSFTFGVGDKTLKKQYNITITNLPEA